ncbi:MAG: GMP synthase [Pseudomonadota bacterium]
MSRYRLGLLQCDEVPDDLRHRFDDYPDMFAGVFAKAGVDIEWRNYNLLDGVFPKSINEVNGFITTGARAGVYDKLPWYLELRKLIRAIDGAKIPLVGICFGHQAIADTLGGEVINSPKGWGIGVYENETKSATSWMFPLKSSFNVPVCHQDQVVTLPRGSQLLASNPHCENFVVQYSKSSLGVQGHPEFETDFLDTLIERRREFLPNDTAAKAHESLKTPHDNVTIIRWIANFLRIGTY